MGSDHPTVLIVEDTPDMGLMLALAVRAYGATGTVVTTGTAALAALAQTAYAVLLTDYHLPDMTGTQLIAQCARLPTPPAMILMSGESQAILSAAMATLPIAATLLKPFPLSALAAALQTCGLRAPTTTPVVPGDRTNTVVR